jgi:fumarate reductase subunit C
MARPYPRQHVSRTWYLKRAPYRLFILREWSAVFVALYFALLVTLAGRAREGVSSLQEYVDVALATPLGIVFHLVTLAFALLHTVTWFQAVPKAIRVRRGDEIVPPQVLIGAHTAAFVGISLVLLACFLIGV